MKYNEFLLWKKAVASPGYVPGLKAQRRELMSIMNI
jgi:hypothetical protein